VVHDVDQQRIPVRFVITSAGLVGSDGPLQCGAFDITFMSCLPNMIVMAPSDEVQLMNMVATATHINNQPVCLRYPRGALVGKSYTVSDRIPIKVIRRHSIFSIHCVILKLGSSKLTNKPKEALFISNFPKVLS